MMEDDVGKLKVGRSPAGAGSGLRPSGGAAEGASPAEPLVPNAGECPEHGVPPILPGICPFCDADERGEPAPLVEWRPEFSAEAAAHMEQLRRQIEPQIIAAKEREARRAWAGLIADQFCVEGAAVVDAIEEGIERGRLLAAQAQWEGPAYEYGVAWGPEDEDAASLRDIRRKARIEELEDALSPFARLAIADDRMAGLAPDALRAAVASARTVLAASGTEARSGGTACGSDPKDDGPTGEAGDAQPPQPGATP